MVKEGNFFDYTTISHLHGQVPVNQLLSNEFLKEHTKFINLGELMKALDEDITKEFDINKLNTEKHNAVIKENSDFASFEEMIKEAGEFYMANNIQF